MSDERFDRLAAILEHKIRASEQHNDPHEEPSFEITLGVVEGLRDVLDAIRESEHLKGALGPGLYSQDISAAEMTKDTVRVGPITPVQE